MSRKHLLWIASLVVLWLSACMTSRAPRLDTSKVLRLDTSKASLPDTTTACADWRWIGIRSPSAAQCPEVPGWEVSPLFGSQLSSLWRGALAQQQKPCDQQQNLDKKQDSDQRSRAEALEELNRFCLYEIADADKNLGDLPFPPAVSADLVRFDQDCAAISPTADLSQATWGIVSEHFLSQVGMTPLKINNRRGVRLAFLDTEPTGVGVPNLPGNSMHGYTLTHIARHLVCSSETGDCAAEITTRLALPYMQFDARSRALTRTAERGGGHIGTQSDLAVAIESEVKSWQNESSQEHLVLNLSVAWDPLLFGGLDVAQRAELRAGTQAVYSALQYARSLDVLVLAAAGNRTQCSPYGPLLPAAWERGVAPGNSCGNAPKAPLVYAVGGVQSDGQILLSARTKGIPRRVTYAENAIVSTGATEQRRIYTGSSVATAVASSIAAVVWDSFPQLNSDEVMKILDASGDELPFPADFWFGASAPPTLWAPRVHRLSLCTALKAACNERRTEPCPLQVDICKPWVPERTDFPKWCSSSPLSAICESWLLPQPGDPPCPNPECPPHDYQ